MVESRQLRLSGRGLSHVQGNYDPNLKPVARGAEALMLINSN